LLKNCSQQKFAHRLGLQHRKTAHSNEEPCWLGWINTMAKCLAESQSVHGWRAPLNGLCCNGWNVLGRTFQPGLFFWLLYSVQSWGNPVPLAHKFGLITVSKFFWRVIGSSWAFPRESAPLDVESSDWVFFVQRAGTVCHCS
jgi:hypothetical protein